MQSGLNIDIAAAFVAEQARGNLAAAIGHLERARELLPALEALDFELAQLYAAADRLDEARDALRRVLARSHDSAAIAVNLSRFQKLLREAGFPDEGALATRHLTARLELFAPAAGARTRIALAELSGRAGLWESAYHDVVLVLDESGSTFAASGADVDGDGKLGRADLSTDPGDSIFAAELVAAEKLTEQFDPDVVRVGLVGFWHEHVVHAALGKPEALLALLREGAVRQPREGATSIALGLAAALEQLADSRDPEVRRQMIAEEDMLVTTGVGGPIEGIVVEATPGHPELAKYHGRALGEIAKSEGKHHIEAMLDIGLAGDLKVLYKTADIASCDPKKVGELVRNQHIIPGVSDGGAHTRFFTGGSFTTEMLTWLVRDTGQLTLEQAHYRLSYLPAAASCARARRRTS